jgi:hypothetical protein
VEEYGKERQDKEDNTIRRMRFACWITKATNTLSEYVTYLCFHRKSGYSNARQCYVYTYIVCLFVSMSVRGKPWMYLSLAGYLYRPLGTFQLWLPDAPAPTDAFHTLAAEVGTYGRGIMTGNLA